jgi:hypothetical protein
MRRIRRHVTFANVVSGIALFVALGGAAAAANHFIKGTGSETIKSVRVRGGHTAVLYNSAFAKLSFRCNSETSGNFKLKNKVRNTALEALVDQGEADPVLSSAIQPGETEVIARVNETPDMLIVHVDNTQHAVLAATTSTILGTINGGQPICDLDFNGASKIP